MLFPFLFPARPAWFLPLLFGLSACAAPRQYIRYQSAQQYTLQDSSGTPPGIRQLMADCHRQLDSQMHSALAYAVHPLTKAQPESALGNLLADALFYNCRADKLEVSAAVLDYQLIGKTFIPPGPLLYADAFELAPYDYKIVIAELSGSALLQLCDTIAAAKGWPVSGLRMVIRGRKATEVRIGEAAVHPQLMYRIATCSYNLKDPLWQTARKWYMPQTLRSTLLRYLALPEQQQLAGTIDNRISYAD